MFGIGFPEMIIILIVALVVVGPDKLPDLARSLAKGVNELRGAMNQIKESLNEETKVISSVKEDLRKTAGQMKDDLLKDNIGGPRRMPNEDTLIEMEADLTEAAGPRPWEQDETISHQETTKETVVDSASAPAEERVMGKNPAAPAV